MASLPFSTCGGVDDALKISTQNHSAPSAGLGACSTASLLAHLFLFYDRTKRPSNVSSAYGRDPNAEERTSAGPRPNGIMGGRPGSLCTHENVIIQM